MPAPRALVLRPLIATGHAVDRMLDYGIGVRDIHAVLRDNPVRVRQKAKEEWREGSGFRMRPPRLRVIGRGAGPRVLTLIIEGPDEKGRWHIVTVFPTSNAADLGRYWRSR